MSLVTVRVFEAEDSAKVADFLSIAYVEGGWPRPARKISDEIRSWLQEQKDGMIRLLAFRDEQAIGVLVLDKRDPTVAYVKWLYVLKDYRRQKVGSSLMRAALERAWARVTPVVSLLTAPDNVAAQGLYTKFGFISMTPPGGYMINFQKLPLLKRFLEENPKAEAKPLGKQTDLHGRSVFPISWRDESTGCEMTLWFERGLAGASIPVGEGSVKTYLTSSERSPGRWWEQLPALLPGATVYLKLGLENEASREAPVRIRIRAPTCLKLSPEQKEFACKLPSKDSISFVYRIEAPSDLKPAFLPIACDISINDYVIPLESSLYATEPFELTVSPARVSPKPGEKLKLKLDVKSRLPKPSTLTVKLEPPEGWFVEGTAQFKNVMPNETVSLEAQIAAVSNVEPGIIEIPVKVSCADAEYEAKARLEVVLPAKCPTCGGFIQSPYWATIDGIRLAFCREACAKDYALPEPEMRRHRLWEAVRRGHHWLRELRRPDGGWRLPHRDGAVVYPGTCGLSSLAALEGRSSPAVQASRQWLVGIQSEEGRIRDGPSTTSSAIMSLLDAGEPSDSPSLRKAALYLKGTQTAEGYWQGWMGPELTTLYCIQALTRLGEPATSKAVQSAVSWVLSKQKPDGSLFDIRAPAVSAQEVIAATTVGLTALALLCIADTGIKAGPTVLEEALKWLVAEQQADGSWGTPERPNPFDTVMAVQALFTYKGLEAREQVGKGVEWLLNNQQPNGSWGDLMGATHIITHSLTKIKAITQVY